MAEIGVATIDARTIRCTDLLNAALRAQFAVGQVGGDDEYQAECFRCAAVFFRCRRGVAGGVIVGGDKCPMVSGGV